MVFLVHYGQTFGNPILTQFGQMGCQLFIFASGYACCFSLQRSGTAQNFYKKRFISIGPGFYTALIVVVIANLLFSRQFGRPFVGVGNTQPVSILCNIALINGVLPFCNNSVFPGGWFIGTIWLLYIIHPFISKLYENAKIKWVPTIILTFLGMVITIVLNYLFKGSIAVENNSFEYFLFTNQLSCYLLGINLYYLRKDSVESSLWIAFGLSFIFLIATIFTFYSGMDFQYLLVCPLMGCFALCFFLALSKFMDNNKNRLITYIGEHSFYISHAYFSCVDNCRGFEEGHLYKVGNH